MKPCFLFIIVGLFCFSISTIAGGRNKKSFRRNADPFFITPFETAVYKREDVQWPLVYPEQYKIAGKMAFQKVQGGSFAPSFGAAFEMIWEQTLFYGLGYEMGFVPKQDSVSGAKLHRFGINTGVIFQLDEYERHHLLALFRPGFSMVRSDAGNATRFGLGLGIGYEYSINSDYIICPEIVYHKYPSGAGTRPGFSNWSFAVRVSFGK